MADAVEPAGHDLQEEAAHELARHQRHELGLVVVAVVLPAEVHPVVSGADQAAVGDRHPMGVAAEVVEDLLGTAEGALGVDDPGGLPQRARQRLDGSGLG